MPDLVACRVDNGIQFFIRDILGPPGELVEMTQIAAVSVRSLLAGRGFFQHARGLDIQTLVFVKAAPEQILDGCPLLG
jgi:hypothetical protein